MVIYIKTEYITLGQFLKFAGIVGTGGEVKMRLSEGGILVNRVIEGRRGRKLYHGDTVLFENKEYKVEKATDCR